MHAHALRCCNWDVVTGLTFLGAEDRQDNILETRARILLRRAFLSGCVLRPSHLPATAYRGWTMTFVPTTVVSWKRLVTRKPRFYLSICDSHPVSMDRLLEVSQLDSS